MDGPVTYQAGNLHGGMQIYLSILSESLEQISPIIADYM